MLKPTHRDVNMHTIVEITQDQSPICLDVTYFIYKKASNESIAVRIEKLDNENRGWKKNFSLPKQFDFHWVKERMETDLPGTGKYKISISIAPHAAFIGDISFCKKCEYLTLFDYYITKRTVMFLIAAPVYETPVYNYLTECKFLDGYKPSFDLSRVDKFICKI